MKTLPTLRSPTLLVMTVLAAALLQMRPARAATDDLPPAAQVGPLILARPEVHSARFALQADQAEAERLRAGPHEYTVRLAGQQRRATDALDGGRSVNRHFGEAQLALERTLRLGAKSAQDAALGEAAVALARMRQADAIHETTRTLLRAWYDWLRERATTALWREQLAAQQDLLRQTERRVQAGDAARTELSLLQAGTAQMQASLAAAQAREESARAALDVHYPGLTQTAPLDLSQPAATDLPGSNTQADRVVQQLVDLSHEWRVARLQADLARERARRTVLDKRPDPTVGVYAASERGGAERVIGVSINLPLPGAARDSGARAALAWSDEAEQQAEAVHLKVRAEAQSQWVAAHAAFATWQRQAEARERTGQALRAVVRGWELGEYGQPEVLLARRQFIDAAAAEVGARSEARYAAQRLHLDLHEILEFDAE